MQHAKHIGLIVLSSVTCLALPCFFFFFIFFHKRHDFQKTVIEHKMCVLLFPKTSV